MKCKDGNALKGRGRTGSEHNCFMSKDGGTMTDKAEENGWMDVCIFIAQTNVLAGQSFIVNLSRFVLGVFQQ